MLVVSHSHACVFVDAQSHISQCCIGSSCNTAELSGFSGFSFSFRVFNDLAGFIVLWLSHIC